MSRIARPRTIRMVRDAGSPGDRTAPRRRRSRLRRPRPLQESANGPRSVSIRFEVHGVFPEAGGLRRTGRETIRHLLSERISNLPGKWSAVTERTHNRAVVNGATTEGLDYSPRRRRAGRRAGTGRPSRGVLGNSTVCCSNPAPGAIMAEVLARDERGRGIGRVRLRCQYDVADVRDRSCMPGGGSPQ